MKSPFGPVAKFVIACFLPMLAQAASVQKFEVLNGYARGIDESGVVLLTRVNSTEVQDWTWSETAGYSLIASRVLGQGHTQIPSDGTAADIGWFQAAIFGAETANLLCQTGTTNPCLFSVNSNSGLLVRQGFWFYDFPCFGVGSCGGVTVNYPTAQIWTPYGSTNWLSLSDLAPLESRFFPGPLVIGGTEYPDGFTFDYPSATYAVGINSASQLVLRSDNQAMSFYAVADVPEPASFLLMAAGAGFMTLRLRRSDSHKQS